MLAAPAVAVTACSIDIFGGGGAGRSGVIDDFDERTRFSCDTCTGEATRGLLFWLLIGERGIWGTGDLSEIVSMRLNEDAATVGRRKVGGGGMFSLSDLGAEGGTAVAAVNNAADRDIDGLSEDSGEGGRFRYSGEPLSVSMLEW